ncbi:GTPase-activating protein and VPS9 domain-containing protein 1-like isoform X1 [Temnothorax longispinosus]|uniref:GTPase-activating protein and VPS9 domain-containing protein 1-like isoform X1 n=1 Tax=Temnothorax longispinosus TaxID=300112 RepID=UPI003A98E65A
MDNDPIWQSASANQLDLARVVVERTVMARVYHNALYLNEDGDVYRDQLFHGHINKLAKVVTSNHRDLRISKVYHYECPWSWAQAELAVISAYKTPRDKLQCVFCCATTIMNLFSMASERGIPAADDLTPVLVYRLIRRRCIDCSICRQLLRESIGGRRTILVDAVLRRDRVKTMD